jgi:protein involved in polysaccharide export with SLBB domain
MVIRTFLPITHKIPMSIRSVFLTALITILGGSIVGCSTPQGPPLYVAAQEINATLYEGLDRLAPGDTLEVKFSYASEFNQSITVQSDGRCSFVGLGPLLAGGLLPEELQDKLQELYGVMLEGRDSTLSVILTLQAPRTVFVMGEVEDPGQITLAAGVELTLLQALAMAGGPEKRTSWLGNALLVRFDPVSKIQSSWVIDIREEHWGRGRTVMLQAYDVLYVPNTRIDDAGLFLDSWIRRMIPFPYFTDLFIPR